MPSHKIEQRRAARQARDRQTDKKALSASICTCLIAQDAYQAAETVMWYIGCKSEVQTLSALRIELNTRKRIVIPYCTYDDLGRRKLGLWQLENLAELTPGTWNIPEPPKARWGETGKEVSPYELDAIVVPGVAFDPKGGRLGNGAGYYDRLLAGVRKDTVLYGVCFESQLLAQVEMDTHDIPMDHVITEKNVYLCRGR